MNGYSIPKATLGRLPQYLEYLRSLPEIRRTISATAIAKALSLGDVQVRKDLASVCGAGKPKIGYETDKLITDIESHLGYERLTNAVLVGAGKLGRALLDYDGFEDFGVKIVAGFDCNETVLTKGTKDILPIRDIEVYCREHDVKLGIITVGQGSAQDVCDKLVESGIKAIWNFTPFRIKVPKNIVVQNTSMYAHLAVMFNRLHEAVSFS